ncbi:MAG TPA: 2-C-methyl-D-erythritol 4-phosphate cytidylyltransferase [Chitinophagaceae bacterium]
MKLYAIIAAGGSGQRMGTTTPKQFLLLNGKPVLWHSVNRFLSTFPDIEVIVVVPAAHLQQAGEICSEFPSVKLVEGGSSRFQSVKNGLQHVKHPSIVFVHDAVRCLVSADLLQRCCKQAIDKGSAIPAVPVTDSLRMISEGSHEVIDRNKIRNIQTPQVFRSEIILPAFNVDENPSFTDEATVVEANGSTVALIEGEASNIKITTPADLQLAAAFLAASPLQ